MPRRGLDFDAVRDIALGLPGVQESSLHGEPSLKLRGKLLACPALHRSADPDSLVVRIGPAERAKLIKADPDAYYLTPHYSKYPMVLVRLTHVDRTSLRRLLKQSWSFVSARAGTAKPKPHSRTKRHPSPK